MFFGSVWNLILRWIGLSTVAPFLPSEHFTQFNFGGGGPQMRQSLLNVIWFATVWELWKERNNMIFKCKEMLDFAFGGQNKVTFLLVVEDEICSFISQLPWLVA